MKRILAILLAAALLLSLASCGQDAQSGSESVLEESGPEIDEGSPSAAVDSLFAAVRAWDEAEMQKYLVDVDDFPLINEDRRDMMELAVLRLVRRMAGRITCKVMSEEIDGDDAVVHVSISAAGTKDVLSDLITGAVKEATAAALTGREPNMEAFIAGFIADIDVEALPLSTNEADVYLVRDGDDWKVDNRGSDAVSEDKHYDLINAITGGALDSVMSLAEKAESLSGLLG